MVSSMVGASQQNVPISKVEETVYENSEYFIKQTDQPQNIQTVKNGNSKNGNNNEKSGSESMNSPASNKLIQKYPFERGMALDQWAAPYYHSPNTQPSVSMHTLSH